jgi:hypothetical protein
MSLVAHSVHNGSNQEGSYAGNSPTRNSLVCDVSECTTRNHNLRRALSRTFPGPQVYKDPHSTTTLYVETDGRHVAAISGDGRLLWNKDPFEDGHLRFYRTKNPKIVYIGPASQSRPDAEPYAGRQPDNFVAITFNNSQFGLLRISNGEFKFLGND